MNTQISTTPTAELYAELLDDLRERRKEQGLTLAALAERVGKSPIFIGAALAGQAKLAPETATKLPRRSRSTNRRSHRSSKRRSGTRIPWSTACTSSSTSTVMRSASGRSKRSATAS